MEKIRTFICIDLPDEIVDYLSTVQNKLQRVGRGVRWVAPQNIHLTIKFLGDVRSDAIDDIAQAVSRACHETPPFSVSLSHTGAFPNFHRPRIFWVGIREESGALLSLYQKMEDELQRLHFAREDRRFSPHLTLGRSKSDDGLEEVSTALQQEKCPALSFVARELIVMQSELAPQGALYTPLAIVPLKM
ncbi:RNA 2',3'-cyclic phosphodiesterase [candidate division KSB1 bacterium]|nr:RNA 2',3'-cyclic phosphodiesterase [candidate division KSB1 bacterium]